MTFNMNWGGALNYAVKSLCVGAVVTLESLFIVRIKKFDIMKFYIQPTDCTCVCCVFITTNSDYFRRQH